ncbi:MAG: hypothetical protein ACO1NS_16505 [Daejeonella sp.]|uniref:hypothetical protein n=1 Tax=Daejeonella sp. JGW-45 TaxID=3034148 RepID=UPI0023EA8ECB|nr:hypothetical protein [Daejeonella sp. JGW-45]
MNNTDEIDFWIFGDARMPKLAVLGSMFGLGLIIGFLAGRPRKKNQAVEEEQKYPASNTSTTQELSSEDREYIR